MNLIDGLVLLQEDTSRSLIISRENESIKIILTKKGSILVCKRSLDFPPIEEKTLGINHIDLMTYGHYLCVNKDNEPLRNKGNENEDMG